MNALLSASSLLARKVELETLLSDRRVELASPDIVRSYAADLRNLLTCSELAERRAFIRSFVKEVRVTGDDVVLTYTMPLMSNGSSVDKIGVLPIVQHGRPDASIANPQIESFFELSLIPASPYGRQNSVNF